MTSNAAPPLYEIFREDDNEYLLSAAPSLYPLFVQRGFLWADDLIAVIVVFLFETLSYVAARRLRRTYRVTVSRRDVSRRPYWWRLLLSEEFNTLEEAEKRQKGIAATWNSWNFAGAEPIKNRRKYTRRVDSSEDI